MTAIPEKDASKEDVQEEKDEGQEVEQEVVEEEPDPGTGKLEVFKEDDPRKAIYEKSDAKRFAPPKTEEAEPEKQEPEADKPPPEEGADTVSTEFTAEEVYEHFKGIPVKTKVDGKVITEDLATLVRAGLKAQGLESKLTRESMELAEQKRQLTEAERQIASRFEAAKAEPKPPPQQTPGGDQLRNLTDEQVQEQFDTLMSESPYRAQKFLDSVKNDKERAAKESAAQRADVATRDFLDTYQDISRDDWIYMNDPAFYEKYPDILRAMARSSETGDYYPIFVAARSRLVEERLSAKQADVSAKEKVREEEVRKRIEAKKKGTVLRVQTRAEQTTKKDEGYQPESRADYIRRVAHERRVAMGLEPPKKS